MVRPRFYPLGETDLPRLIDQDQHTEERMVVEHSEKSDLQVKKLVSLCLKASRYAAETPEFSLSLARKAAEAICVHIFTREIGTPERIVLGDLLKQLGAKNVLSNRILIPLHTIQHYGNYGSHYQEEGLEVDTEFVIPCLAALRQVLNWYFQKYLNIEIPYEISSFVKSTEQSTPVDHRLDKNLELFAISRPTLISSGGEKSLEKHHSHLPSDVLNLIATDLYLSCPCTTEIAQKANEMTPFFYGDEAVAFSTYQKWLTKNHQILVCLTGADKNVLGYFDVLPLSDDFVASFVVGKVGESDIQPEHILSPRDALSCRQLYLSGMAVRCPNTFVGKRNATILLWGLLHYLKNYYPGSNSRILYGLGSTTDGNDLLKRFNFTLLGAETERSDKHNFYALPFTNFLIDEYLSLFQDWSATCKLSWM